MSLRCVSVKARRNGFSVLQSFWIMGIFAILPEVEIRPPMFANLKNESTRNGWGGGCLGVWREMGVWMVSLVAALAEVCLWI